MNTTHRIRPPKTAAQEYLDGGETGWDVIYGVQKSKKSTAVIGRLKGLWLLGLGLSASALVGWTTLHRIQNRTPSSSQEETFAYSLTDRSTLNH
jgi:hypothetical protein